MSCSAVHVDNSRSRSSAGAIQEAIDLVLPDSISVKIAICDS